MKKPEKLIRPVLCIGLQQGKTAVLIPLMCVDFFEHNQRSKRIFINWTYGKPIGNEVSSSKDIKFDSELGKMKLLQLEKLKVDGIVQIRFMMPSSRGRTYSERIKDIIDWTQDGERILFIIPKEVDDSEFYAALSISVSDDGEVKMDEDIMGDPVLTLKELGVSVEEPFIEVDPRK